MFVYITGFLIELAFITVFLLPDQLLNKLPFNFWLLVCDASADLTRV